MKKERYSRPVDMEFSDATKLEALRRADFTCEDCGTKKQDTKEGCLQIHHIVGIALALRHHPELSHAMISSIHNTAVLCQTCHKKRDVEDRKNHVENAKKLEEYFTKQLALALLV